MQMGIFTTAFGRKTKPMVKEFTVIWMELDMKATGKRTSNMEKA